MEKFFRLIVELQKKPEHIRRRILYISTAVGSGLIFLFWVSIFPAQLGRLDARSQQASTSETPTSILKKLFQDTAGGIKDVKEGFNAQVKYTRSQVPEAEIKAVLEKEGILLPSATGTPTSSQDILPENVSL
jgi:hypothetical protein